MYLNMIQNYVLILGKNTQSKKVMIALKHLHANTSLCPIFAII